MKTDDAREVLVGMHAEGKAAETIKLTNEMFDALEVAIEALGQPDGQARLEVVINESNGSLDEVCCYMYRCPSCDNGTVFEGSNFCYCCGAKIKWVKGGADDTK